jgi:aquaporin Z
MPESKVHHLAANVATELVGTMFLCLTVSLAAGNSALAPIGIGFVLMVVVYAGGHISGANYNPAVTLAILVRGAIEPLDAAMYIPAQLLGAAIGGWLSFALIGEAKSGYPAVGSIQRVDSTSGSFPNIVLQKVPIGSALLCEIVLTFALCYVVLLTATTKKQSNNSYFGMAIGFTVLSGAVSVGGLSGGAFNPAVGILPWLHNEFEDSWIYWVGPLVGGALAGGIFRVIEPGEYTDNPNKTLEMVAPYINECIGTLMLCYTVATAASATNTSGLAPLSIGSILMCMIYAGGSISGGHYNPVVTAAVLGRTLFGATHDNFDWKKALPYVVFQVVGSLLGSLLAWGSFPEQGDVGYPQLPAGDDVGKGILGEVLGTFLLVYVILNVATVTQVAGNSFFGVAIGMVVTSMAIAIGPITGGAFNPAVGLISLFVGDPGRQIWIYWVGPPLGSCAALMFFRFQNYTEFHTPKDMVDYQYHVPEAKANKSGKFMCHNHEERVGKGAQKGDQAATTI